VVFSKYILSLIFIDLCLLVYGVISLFVGNESISENIYNFISVANLVLLWMAISYPIVFRMGVDRGRIFLIALMFIPCCLAYAIGQNELMNIVSYLNNSFDFYSQGGYLLMFVLCLGIFALSGLFSAKIFEKKDL
jgi:hypothetical protein